ncbi:vWA domain-containing protein [Roseibium sp.]|uniref:vWA domain-containing protein n=1 Tax=Roseibium sp. TaxID=1936156 RepID=UPI003B511736
MKRNVISRHARSIAVSVAISAMTATGAYASATDILFILDGSGSMWGQIDKIAKITTAKETLTKLIDDVPDGARVGLMTYGTQSKESCVDFRTLNEIGASAEAIKASIADIKPLGKTPMGMSLSVGIASLSKVEPLDRQKAVVLISDGIETCDSDPCTSAAMAKYLGVNMKVHVVGFDVDQEAKAQLQCIANAGGGQYFNADDTAGFNKAMEEVIEVAQAAPVVIAQVAPAAAEEAPAEPEGPVITEFFREDFDGEVLSDRFEIENENPDNYIVDGGVLTVLSTKFGTFDAEAPENLFKYTGELPRGDWDVEIQFTGEYTAKADRLTLGLRKDENNYIATGHFGMLFSAARCQKTEMFLTKMTKGEADSHGRPMRAVKDGQCYHAKPFGGEANWDVIQADLLEKPIKLTFSKRGRAYTSKIEMVGFTDPDGNPYILESDKYTSLRSPGTLAFQVDRMNNSSYASGEVLMMIDSLVINEVKSGGQ